MILRIPVEYRFILVHKFFYIDEKIKRIEGNFKRLFTSYEIDQSIMHNFSIIVLKTTDEKPRGQV